ncbi:unnamed protein product [Arabidopsis lyrata]|uniref:Uncharacterized protein n=1 Tax=Arabidopsis thaliana x Arabidopsis arenosa TaxID=1240361 RepID=A0A8T1YY82_9BRAS|nr:hypothetical protein ISN45_Aa06g021550 [Arabidopsis thaliana x Arabidopsis arenosa]CAH8259349.1 unnamed protein product [Arabidopsis lyrata]
MDRAEKKNSEPNLRSSRDACSLYNGQKPQITSVTVIIKPDIFLSWFKLIKIQQF